MSANNLRLNKSASKIPVHVLIKGDQLTSKLMLSIDRYSDGIDLSALGFAVYVKNASGAQDIINVTSTKVTDNDIVIEWILPQIVGASVGVTDFCVVAVNAQNNKVWQSGVRQIKVDSKFEVTPNYSPSTLSNFERVLSETTVEMGQMRSTMEGFEDQIEQASNAAYAAASNANSIYTIVKQAYESGAFNGADGSDGRDGRDGVDGRTPVKGTDYFTDADKASMISSVKAGVQPSVSAIESSLSQITNTVAGKADKTELPDMSTYAKKTDVPAPYDDTSIRSEISQKADKTEIPDVSGLAKKSEIPDLSGYAKKTEIPAPYDDTELKTDLTALNSTKVGYSEVVNGKLLMYSDSTKAHLLATLDLPQTDISGKQDTIADLDTIRSGAASGATALQSVPIATNGGGIGGIKYGGSQYGLSIDSAGNVSISASSTAQIDARTQTNKPIVPATLNYAVKAALTDSNAMVLDDAAKAKACETVGAVHDSNFVLIEDVTVDVDGKFDRVSEPNGTQYNFSDIVIRIEQTSGNSVRIRVRDINNTQWIFYGSTSSSHKNIVYKCLNHHGMLVSNLVVGNDFSGSAVITGGTYESFGYTIGHIYLENVIAGTNIKIYAIRA